MISSHQHIPKNFKNNCTTASSFVTLISMGAVCYAYECKYSECKLMFFIT